MKNSYFLSVFILLIGFVFTSCKNEPTDPTVTYQVTTNNGNFDIAYLNEDGKTIKKTIKSNSWTTSFIGEKGDSVSLEIIAINLNDKIDAKIIYDGKIIQKAVTYGQKSGDKVSADISTVIPY